MSSEILVYFEMNFNISLHFRESKEETKNETAFIVCTSLKSNTNPELLKKLLAISHKVTTSDPEDPKYPLLELSAVGFFLSS